MCSKPFRQLLAQALQQLVVNVRGTVGPQWKSLLLQWLLLLGGQASIASACFDSNNQAWLDRVQYLACANDPDDLALERLLGRVVLGQQPQIGVCPAGECGPSAA